jgi:hypothetical protein
MSELTKWWRDNATDALTRTVPKIEEYGANDLTHIGHTMARLMEWQIDDTQAAELGIWFYLNGKIARAFEALEQHRMPSDDTIFDTKIYATMIERIRQNGAL